MKISKQNIKIYLLAILLIFVVIFSCNNNDELKYQKEPKRIISLAPAITETLFALRLGDRLIGVTTYCKYPPQANKIEKVGGYIDANIEKIIALKPDLVILSKEHDKTKHELINMGIAVLQVDLSSIANICTSFVLIGKRCNVLSAAESLSNIFKNKIIDQKTTKKTNLKVCFCVGHDMPGTGDISSVFVAGDISYYNDLIEAAGASNIIKNKKLEYLKLSKEGIIALKPDLIIEAAITMENFPCSLLINDWKSLNMIPAVRNNKIFCINKDYTTIPGPRLIFLFEDIKKIITENY
jgi:iron complex transport system substrate-binding protein